jgi:outer membrane protein OmpA-like peptidoglycan-associated protein
MKEAQMKRLLIIFMVTALGLAGCAAPQNKAEKGTRIGVVGGAAGGALLGQVIGRSTGATLIGAGIGALAGGLAGHKIGQNMDEQEAAMRRELAAVEAANIQRNADMLAVTFRNDTFFDVNSAVLKSGGVADIQRVSTVLNQYPQTRIQIAGHTDSSGPEAYNQELSQRRAKAVKNTLVGQGVSPERIQTIGFGESAPIADNGSEGGRQLNRRVVITIQPQA